MKSIILAGGLGSRLRPLTNVTNKHLVAVYDRPMIDYPLQTLINAGFKEILIVSGREHAGHFLEYLGSGKEYGIDITYKVQEEAGGIAQALGIASNYVGNDDVCVILGDNIFEDDLDMNVDEGRAKVFLKKVKDANRFGVARFNENEEIEVIIEKPKDILEGYAVTGLYIYPNDVFKVISRLKPSARGEMEITDINNYYARLGLLDYQKIEGFWGDAGTFDSLATATQWAIHNND